MDDENGDSGELTRVTFTISQRDKKRLRQLTRWWSETDPRATSATVRRIIRETFEREKRQRGGNGK